MDALYRLHCLNKFEYLVPHFQNTDTFFWLVVVAAPELLEDIKKASDKQISFLAALDQVCVLLSLVDI